MTRRRPAPSRVPSGYPSARPATACAGSFVWTWTWDEFSFCAAAARAAAALQSPLDGSVRRPQLPLSGSYSGMYEPQWLSVTVLSQSAGEGGGEEEGAAREEDW